MEKSEMAANECVPLQDGKDSGLDKVRLLELSEAIKQLDSMVTDLERALRMDKGQPEAKR